MSILGLTENQWIDIGVSLLIILIAAIIGRWIIHWVFDRVIRRLVSRTRTDLDDLIVDATRPAVFWIFLLVVVHFSIQRLSFLPWTDNWQEVMFILALVIGFVAMWRLLGNFFTWYGGEIASKTDTKLDEQLVPFFRRVAMILLSVIALIILLGHFEVDVSALVTTMGIGSLAFALAAKETLSDTISGFVIMVDRPYRLGDRVEIQDLDTWGDVIDIGLRSTRIRTRDNRTVIIPNSVIGKSLIVNHSYPDTQYRIQVNIGVGYGTDLEFARKTMIDAIRSVDGVLQERKIEALFLEFGPSALIFRVRWWIESYVDTRRMFDSVNTAVYNALNKAEIELPFPTRELHHKFGEDTFKEVKAILRS